MPTESRRTGHAGRTGRGRLSASAYGFKRLAAEERLQAKGLAELAAARRDTAEARAAPGGSGAHSVALSRALSFVIDRADLKARRAGARRARAAPPLRTPTCDDACADEMLLATAADTTYGYYL